MSKFSRVCLGLFIAIVASDQATSQEIDFSRVAIFGDSLSDTGNLFFYEEMGYPFSGPGALFPTPPYAFGRFSNGPIWIEEFNQDLTYPSPTPFVVDPTSLNFAFGGAETGLGFSQRLTPNLGLQVGFFAQAYPAGFQGDELVVVWGGGNDFNPLPGMPIPTPEAVVANTTDRVRELIALGGTTFLVPNLPPLGSIPQVRDLGPLAEWWLNLTVFEHNLLLSRAMRDLEAEFGVRIYQINTFAIVSAVSANPQEFGFANTTEAAFDLLTGEIVENPHEYVYWDTIHPTSAAHQLLGSVAASSLATQRMTDYVQDSGANGLAIRGFLSSWIRFDLTLRLIIANHSLQSGCFDVATETLQGFQDKASSLARQRRISRSDAATLIAQAQLAINAIAD